jgi:hypothetical protein
MDMSGVRREHPDEIEPILGAVHHQHMAVGPPPNPASFRPVELSPWPGWFGSADAADANPKDVSTTAATTNARFIAYPSLQRTPYPSTTRTHARIHLP